MKPTCRERGRAEAWGQRGILVPVVPAVPPLLGVCPYEQYIPPFCLAVEFPRGLWSGEQKVTLYAPPAVSRPRRRGGRGPCRAGPGPGSWGVGAAPGRRGLPRPRRRALAQKRGPLSLALQSGGVFRTLPPLGFVCLYVLLPIARQALPLRHRTSLLTLKLREKYPAR